MIHPVLSVAAVHSKQKVTLFHLIVLLKGGVLNGAGEQRGDIVGIGRLQRCRAGHGQHKVLPDSLRHQITACYLAVGLFRSVCHTAHGDGRHNCHGNQYLQPFLALFTLRQ